MNRILIPAIALCFAGTAIAQTAPAPERAYPLCSKTVTDECVNPSQATKAELRAAKKAAKAKPVAAKKAKMVAKTDRKS